MLLRCKLSYMLTVTFGCFPLIDSIYRKIFLYQKSCVIYYYLLSWSKSITQPIIRAFEKNVANWCNHSIFVYPWKNLRNNNFFNMQSFWWYIFNSSYILRSGKQFVTHFIVEKFRDHRLSTQYLPLSENDRANFVQDFARPPLIL